jgi:hypothetical protein
MAELIYSTDFFTILPGHPSISISTVFNSSNIRAGGDWLGPMVPAAGTVFQNQTVVPSTVGVEWKAPTSELTSNCIYHYSMRYDGPVPCIFSPIFFVNG